MRIVPIRQRDDSACGPTCIKMVADYFGVDCLLEDIETLSQYKQKEGMTNHDLVDTLRRLAFDVEARSDATWEDLIQCTSNDSVVIVSWMLHGYIGHFSVIESIDEHNIVLADSEAGQMITLEKIVFLRLWMDYDDLWYPQKNTDIQLRWMAVVWRPKGMEKT